MKKKVDSRIQTLIQNNIKSHQRSMFILVGDRSRYQIVNFHYILTRNTMKAKPKVLWCYSKDLGFSSHQKKRMNQIKNLQNKGLYDENVDNPFDLFVSSTQIRYTFYHESHKILGNTYQMLILQDFEALTPNVLCRTIQTVQGGGLIVFMLKTMDSLKQLYSLTMDVHQRYRTQAFKNVQPRFNQRFILSLKQCHSCIFMDDELNILPISEHATQQIKPINANQVTNKKAVQQLQSLKEELKVKDIVGPLIGTSKTLDQAKVIMSMIDVLVQKNNKTTFSLTAARGRGKSAAIGLGIAAAIKIGYSNIFVTAPSPNNLKTLFDFVVVGLQLLDFKERMDFQKIYSTNKDYDRAVIRINLFKSHTQFIQFVFPNDADKIGHSDLVVIDQAAAIPLPFVKSFFGPHSVFLSSTINGYEGTGRSLSLKLIKQIKQQNKKGKEGSISFRKFKEVTMTDPIRYALNDEIQKWLSDLLMLSATQATPLKQGIPHPKDCQLYIVNRDALFSYKKVCEKFLHSLMALFIASHYKNSPNDLQLLSDSPSHLIFILVGPLRQSQSGKTQMPDILCAIQVALQGNLSSANITNNTQRGLKPSGDLIPWTIREQFQDSNFPQLAGARVVRIATHPAHQKQGYGSKALQLLVDFFERKLISMNDNVQIVNYDFKGEGVSKPLLKKLDEINPPNISYIGTSFGFTTNLVKFWRKNGFQPTYLRQTVNDTTSQHSGIMLKSLDNESKKLNLQHYVKDFSRRFMNLLPREFKKLSPGLAIQVIEYTNRKKERATESQKNQVQMMGKDHFRHFISYLDYKRLQSYANNQSDYHLIIDLVADLTKLYFSGKLGIQNFNYTWEAILVGVGLQHKNIQEVTKEIGDGDSCHVSNSLALFKKALIRFYKISKQIYSQNIEEKVPQQKKLQNESVLNDPKKDQQIADEEVKKIRDVKGNKKRLINYELEDQEIQQLQNEQITEGKVITLERSSKVARNEGFENKKKKKVKRE